MNKSANPFIVRIKESKPADIGSKYYKSVEVKEIFKSTGQCDENGDPLGVAVKKYIVKKKDIKQLINADADSVGVYNLLKQLQKSGEELPDIRYEDINKAPILDISNCPNNLMDAVKMSDNIKKEFDKLPDALKRGKDLEEFLKTFNNNDLKAYIDSLVSQRLEKKPIDKPVNEEVKEDKKNGF